jgi:hypothetical protein
MEMEAVLDCNWRDGAKHCSGFSRVESCAYREESESIEDKQIASKCVNT